MQAVHAASGHTQLNQSGLHRKGTAQMMLVRSTGGDVFSNTTNCLHQPPAAAHTYNYYSPLSTFSVRTSVAAWAMGTTRTNENEVWGTTTSTHTAAPAVVAASGQIDVLSSPLERMRQTGLGWVGVILEYEGVIVESGFEVELAAWKTLAAELQVGSDPNTYALKRAQGMLPEHIISQVLCWTRNPTRIQEIARRFEKLVADALDPKAQKLLDGTRTILRSLYNTGDVAFAVVSSSPTERVRAGLFSNGIQDLFRNQMKLTPSSPSSSSSVHSADERKDSEKEEKGLAPIAIVAAEDISRGRPDPEAYLYASSKIQR